MEKAHLASEQLETGSVGVNTGMIAIAEAPFGGINKADMEEKVVLMLLKIT